MTGAIHGQTQRRVVLLNDTSAWYHWGCTCTSRALRDEIEARGFALDTVPINAVYQCRETPDRIADFRDAAFFGRFRAANGEVVDRLADADIVVINGEGTLHGTEPRVRNLLYLAYAAKKHLGKETQIINHSCFPEDAACVSHGPAGALYTLVYEAMDFVAAREPISARILEALGVPATQAFDSLPLFVERHHASRPRGRRVNIVMAGSAAWTREGIVALGDFIQRCRQRGQPVSVLVGAKAQAARDEAAFVAALRDAAPEGWALVEAGSAQAWLDVIAGAACLVSGRFHHTIAAFCLGTPSVVLSSNTPKMEGMLAMVDQPPPLCPADADFPARLAERAEAALDGRLPPPSEQTMARVRVLARQNFAGLDALGSKPGRDRLESMVDPSSATANEA